jgi:hypothetical protein
MPDPGISYHSPVYIAVWELHRYKSENDLPLYETRVSSRQVDTVRKIRLQSTGFTENVYFSLKVHLSPADRYEDS